ncbi:hypothetical protein CI610_00352 [invertebrate metagenome]|uniref:DUF3168 domain-containing protein n=1 Tax=invertebrate metagenome TaxID=1711999 RepID=A0A2H9TBR5_9ZZZZ
MRLEESLFHHLQASVQASIYANLRGDKLPAVVYTLVSDPVTMSLSNVEQVHTSRYQVDCYHRNYAKVKKLAEQIKDALHLKSKNLAGYPIQLVVMENRQDGYVEQAGLFRQMMEFVVYH